MDTTHHEKLLQSISQGGTTEHTSSTGTMLTRSYTNASTKTMWKIQQYSLSIPIKLWKIYKNVTVSIFYSPHAMFFINLKAPN